MKINVQLSTWVKYGRFGIDCICTLIKCLRIVQKVFPWKLCLDLGLNIWGNIEINRKDTMHTYISTPSTNISTYLGKKGNNVWYSKRYILIVQLSSWDIFGKIDINYLCFLMQRLHITQAGFSRKLCLEHGLKNTSEH